MSSLDVQLDDGGLDAALEELQAFTVSTVITRTINEMVEDLKGNTPRVTGSLINSLRQEVSETEGTIGYTAEHAPHVEYGHRQEPGRFVPKLGKRLKASYVEGQHFLSEEVTAAEIVFKRRISEALKKAGL